MLEVSRIMPNLPRDCRYTLGQELRNRIMGILVFIYRANRLNDKSDVIARMREILLEIQVYIRMMCDLRYISEGCYVRLAEQTSSISKQMVAWEKSEIRKKAGVNIE